MEQRRLIAYYRVSTSKQARSGLGLEAQKERVRVFVEIEESELVNEYVDVETGKGFDALKRRPILAQALKEAKSKNCWIAVAKLDRLGRNVAFIASLMETKVPLVVAELGFDVDSFMLHIYAAVAEKERELISQRTKEGLAAAKRRGVRLGNRTNLMEAQQKGTLANRESAQSFVSAT